MDKTTSRPWHIEGAHQDYWIAGPGKWGGCPMVLPFDARADKPTREDIDLIIHAVNHHEELVDMVKRLAETLDEYYTGEDQWKAYEEGLLKEARELVTKARLL